MHCNAKPLSVLLDPDIGRPPFEIKRFALVGALHLELDSHNRSLAVNMRLLVGFFDLGYPGSVRLQRFQKFRLAPELPGRTGIYVSIGKYRRQLVEVSAQQSVRVLVFSAFDRIENALVRVGFLTVQAEVRS